MKQKLTQIYRDLSNGKLTPQEALESIKDIKLSYQDEEQGQGTGTPALLHGAQPLVSEAEAAEPDPAKLTEKTQVYLSKQLSALLKLPFHKIDPRAPLEKYGIDSILAMDLTRQLEETFGPLSKTLFFEYQCINELTDYFVKAHSARLAGLFATADSSGDSSNNNSGITAIEALPETLSQTQTRLGAGRRSSRQRRISFPAGLISPMAAFSSMNTEPVAIIGLSGRYPEAIDIEAYWRNLREAKDCIIEVPEERWDWREYYSTDRSESGCHYSKWGGFIDGVDEFDPLFFNISPVEAELIDPQERLFLQHTWMAVEDAGYTRSSLQIPHEQDLPGQVGVYVGVMYGEYQLFGAEASLRGRRMGFANNLASIANRVSYVLNLHGPSMTLDTMCSSSLTAIHLACQDLKQGRTDLGIAGGVNVSVHPGKYLMLSAGQFISSDGHCQSFGEGGDGYIPGEGVGVAVLKRFSEAKRDGNHIYGLIKGSALSHGGKTNGYTVPNPQAQASAIGKALIESNTDPRHISYVETHGTGTKLGDPIEIAALSKVFNQYTQDTGFCLIGSAKSNIGHCESAAGIAGLTKVLLQMKYRQIVPSLHSARLNPHIDFKNSPFVVNQTLRAWDQPAIDGRPQPRIAGVSSFGAGGSNAHIIVEEYLPPAEAKKTNALIGRNTRVIIPLSARTAGQLQQKARDLFGFIHRSDKAMDLLAMAYTLQVGREEMDERLGFIVGSVAQLAEKLGAYIDGGQDIEEVYQGQVKRGKEGMSVISQDDDMREAIDKWIARKKLSKLLDLWVKGLELDWNKLYAEVKPQLISLPTYPFARQRYWVDTGAGGKLFTGVARVLHPLLHANTSDLVQQRYSSTFSGEEFFLKDHKVQGKKLLPGVACLEMARAAVELALPEQQPPRIPEPPIVELHNIVWLQPVAVTESKQISIALFANTAEGCPNSEIEYEIYSQEEEEEIVHCRGQAVFSRQSAPARLDVEQLKGQMLRGSLDASVYASFAGMGLHYGPAHQGISAIYLGEKQLLAQLRLPAVVEASQSDYLLHPSLMDSALQAGTGLLVDLDRHPRQPPVPFALASLRIVSACTREMFAWVRYSQGSRSEDKIVKLDIDLCDREGNVCVQMRGLCARTLTADFGMAGERGETTGSLLAMPVWRPDTIAASANAGKEEYTEEHVILCEIPHVHVEHLEALLPHSHCLSLNSQQVQQKSIAERYSEVALACFEVVQRILKSKPKGKALIQIVVASEREASVFAGLSGLLKTAALENPKIIGQIILTKPETTAGELATQLRESKIVAVETVVNYQQGSRQILSWQEIQAGPEKTDIVLKDRGVYLITGGLGGLGVLFAKEILRQTQNARIILTGRSALTEKELDAKKQVIAEGLSAGTDRLDYRQLDIENPDQVRQLIAAIEADYKQLNGIIHSAGMVLDNFILKKTPAEFRQVLAPKVAGTFNLDQTSKDIALDFLVLFSSGASVLGNLGQADYAAANGFMDQFAAYRNQLVAVGQRRGQTLSINWPLWQEGGMSLNPASLAMLQQTTGMRPMQTATGMRAFYHSLNLPLGQVLIVEGEVSRLRRLLFTSQAEPSAALTQVAQTPVPEVSGAQTELDNLLDKTQDYLIRQFSALLKLPTHELDPEAPLEKYGIDSILAMNLTNHLEKTFGSLSKTLLFEYQTIRELTEYFLQSHTARLAGLVAATDVNQVTSPAVSPEIRNGLIPGKRLSRQRYIAGGSQPRAINRDSIAIIGLSGRYPAAADIEAYWHNLRDGKDCIVEVPKERWDWRQYYSEDRAQSGRHYSKWGGFIDGVDQFDPRLFNISPREASSIDPQERLFLQHAWMAVEDAGYTRSTLQIPHGQGLAGQVGVYVGVMFGEYNLSGSLASIANRVSYVLNLHGPSMTLDTMCSSSLTAIHIACQDLKQGRTDMAIAGGVNISIHPNKYLVLSAGQFISGDGHCQSFGEGGDGYIPGEGVGVVILKRLSEAQKEGDPIYGIISGSALNHGGKTNGYTVPNPQAQASVISQALAESNTDPRHISYIEAHGTGTRLGDPIEIAALSKAYRPHTGDTGFCLIGSAKSNIGHCESAAGIAGLTKVLLQLQHRQIVPSLHSARLNPHIDFENSPFVVNQTLRAWDQPVMDGKPYPRIAGVSSFGAGGANAHLIVEEYIPPAEVKQPVSVDRNTGVIIPLSARTEEQLQQKARDLLNFIGKREVDLPAMAYTLQVGREAMDERLGFIVGSVEQLAEKLQAYIDGGQDIEDAYRGQVNRNRDALTLFSTDADFAETIDKWIARKKLPKLLDLWCRGLELDWNRLYGENNPARISLPTYPFARERYWKAVAADGRPAAGISTTALHPLLHSNTSNFSQQSYSSVFSGEEFFLRDYLLCNSKKRGQKILPAVACLEMARVAVEQASPAQLEAGILELHNTVWAQPIVVTAEKKQITIALLENGNGQIDYEIYSQSQNQEMVHCQGRAVFRPQPAPARLDIDRLKKQIGQAGPEADSLYQTFARAGLDYGSFYRGITALYQANNQLLAELRLPAAVENTHSDFSLHPGVLESALQASIALAEDLNQLSGPPPVAVALESLRIVSACAQKMVAWVRHSQAGVPENGAESGRESGLPGLKLDIDLCDEQGNICVQFRGLSLRHLAVNGDCDVVQQSPDTGARPSGQPVAGAQEESQPLFFEEHWQEQPLTTAVAQADNRQIIIFSDAQYREEVAGSENAGLPANAIFVNHADSYREIGVWEYQCGSDNAAEIQKVLNRASAEANAPIAIIYMWARGQGEKGIHRLFTLFKAVKESTHPVTHVTLAGYYDPLSVEACWDYSWIGFERSLKQHLPKTQISLLYTDSPSCTPQQLTDAAQRSGVIWYRGEQRFALAFKPFELDKTAQGPVIKQNGSYLITGGCGALGLKFARYLAENYQAKLLLTGRRPLSPRIQEQLDALQRAGAQAVYYQAVDIGDREALASWAQNLPFKLTGIIHAAGVESNQPFHERSAADVNQILHPKSIGTLLLDEVLDQQPLDFVCYFSSSSAQLGDFGSCDYAIANRFQMAYACYREQTKQDKGKTIVINWPLWQGGMGYKDSGQREQIELYLKMSAQEFGQKPLTTEAGLDIWHGIMRANQLQTLVMVGKPGRVEKFLHKFYQNKQQFGAADATDVGKRNRYEYANKAEEFYSLILPSVDSEMEYLTFCPFEKRMPGFSMSRVFLNPKRYPEERSYVRLKQTEMRQVLFCKEEFNHIHSVFDFGCGHGTDVIQMGSLFPHLQVHGFTITRDQATLGNKRIVNKNLSSRVEIFHRDSAKDAFPSRYDVIFGIEVSLHIEDKEGLYRNICNSLNDNGRILLMDMISNQQDALDDSSIGASIPTQQAWIDIISRFQLEIDDIIDVSPQIANFLYDPDVDNQVERFPEVTQKTYQRYADLSITLGNGSLSYVLIKLKRSTDSNPEKIEAHNWEKLRNPTPYPVALKAMLAQGEIHYPPADIQISDWSKIETVIFREKPQRGVYSPATAVPVNSLPSMEVGIAVSQEGLQQQLRMSLASALRMKPSDIDINLPFGDLGLDSVVGLEWVSAINQTYATTLSNIVVYDYPSVKELALFLEKEINGLPVSSVERMPPALNNRHSLPSISNYPSLERKIRNRRTLKSHHTPSKDKVAIVGMSGRYPQANTLQQYWSNLVQGVDSIVEIPPSRWDINQYYDPDPARKDKTVSKWLGMLDDADCFDPLFFRISPQEAEGMDPQHRLFLQESYRAFEDAGYSRNTLSNAKCGVYLGIATNEYSLLLSRNSSESVPVTSNSFAIAAARIAYYLNLKGPAIAVDTACSSSLVAIHLASQALLNHEIDMALAGGVSLWLAPGSYQDMSQAGMLSPDGRCKAFDDSANGIVVADGVGALVIKRLQDAEKDKDLIYGVISGSGINQDGKTSGITAPSVNSQIELEREIYSKYDIDPETITYVETHGTGTKLGDPIELQALATVFKERTDKKNYCALASVKSNIGHTSAAAGVASVQKVLLSLLHRTLAPTLNVTKENSLFDFKNSPFYINKEKRAWDISPGSPRRAAVSSFGYSGTNAHLVIEEYLPETNLDQPVSATPRDTKVIVPLSARTAEQLLQKARDLLGFLSHSAQHTEIKEQAFRSVDLHAVAYTLQVGREAMEERLGFIVNSVDQLIHKLRAYIAGDGDIEDIYQGQVNEDTATALNADGDMHKLVDQWLYNKKLSNLSGVWVKGLDLDWCKLYGDYKPQRISLPTYPFARERYWINSTRLNARSDDGLKLTENFRLIEDIINKIDNDSMETKQAVELLNALTN